MAQEIIKPEELNEKQQKTIEKIKTIYLNDMKPVFDRTNEIITDEQKNSLLMANKKIISLINDKRNGLVEYHFETDCYGQKYKVYDKAYNISFDGFETFIIKYNMPIIDIKTK